MIALPHDLPFIRIGEHSLAVCESQWLTDTLSNAANAATDGPQSTSSPVPDWLVEDISQGVQSYLKNHFPGSVIDSKDLFEKIGKTLSSLGLSHVAAKMDTSPPPIRISLTDLVRRAGDGYELAFFDLLARTVRSAAEEGAHEVQCHGLDRCVKKLASSKRWSRRCETLKAEIKAFLADAEEQSADANPFIEVSVAQ
ncbi:MAG: hypothetical protein AAF236_14095 [Verrucomicrobiota bacterium]